VAELLEMMVGRIPVEKAFRVRLIEEASEKDRILALVDRRGEVRQKIFMDSTGMPYRAEWFDPKGRLLHSLVRRGDQRINDFFLPQQIELSDVPGNHVLIRIERYEANATIEESLFTLDPPPG
jgi:hypothetical protein